MKVVSRTVSGTVIWVLRQENGSVCTFYSPVLRGKANRILGYGATTLPALTESITIEKNATLAAEEAKRLEDLVDKLTELLKA